MAELDPGRNFLTAMLDKGYSRRDFMKFCGLMAGALALPKSSTMTIAQALQTSQRPTVLWLEMQDCAGCSEALLRASSPSVAELLLEIISLDYHETIMAASGAAAEASKAAALKQGGYLLVVEGSIPKRDDGIYCCVSGKTSLDLLGEAASGATAIIAVGNCAAFGGVASASPNPTEAVGVGDLITDKPLINLPGCPVNTVNLVATIVHYLTFKRLPSVDDQQRPLFAYGSLIHDNCERRGHFVAGEFVREWGDEGHRQGWCLYQMGCKGPMTYHNCPSVRYNDGTSWPVAAGHGCIGCAEAGFWDNPIYTPVHIQDYSLPSTYPPVYQESNLVSTQGAAINGGVLGAIVGAAGAFTYAALTNRAKGLAPAVDLKDPDEPAPKDPKDQG